ncbi:MAG: hypothetical protein KatS3mg077_2410 [Candidatus Binatia bacterium]|nr:MAG: hypothetical protein KatS3mg077_2410 [Candidatus Binatia bacterium]
MLKEPPCSPTLMRRAVCIFLLASLFACGDDGESDRTAPVGAFLGSEYRFELQDRTGESSLLRGGRRLLLIPSNGWQLGQVDRVDPGVNYDPYHLFAPSGLYSAPEGLHWLEPEKIEVRFRTTTRFDARVIYGAGAEGELTVSELAPGRFCADWRPPSNRPIAYFRIRFAAPEEEGFYGLGEYFDDVNHRGKLRAMQIEVDPEIESFYNEAHVPVPFLIGSTGWGVFVPTYYPGVFDVQKSTPEWVEVVFGTGEASGAGLRVCFLVAASGLDVTRHYYELTGYPRLPPAWVLGPLVWRDENRDQAQFEQDLRTMRELDLAATGVWIDRPYARAVNSFDFDPVRFPDPARMFAEAQRLGYRVALWHTPYLDTRAEATRPLREEASARGFYPPRTGLLLNPWGRPIDFTNSEAHQWWQSLLGRYRSLGVAGFKLDYGEDVVVGVTAQRNRWLFADGSDERTMHARYQLFYHRTYSEILPEEGGLLLVRHSTIGGQVFGPVIWPGDLDASFARHRERVTEKGVTYVAVGGLPAAIIAGSSLGPSGFPLFASDTGGYRHSPPDKELFARWFQHTALSPAMQIGTSSNDVAWEPTPDNGFDAELLDWYRKYTRLHLRLFPYLWTYLNRLLEDGRAIQRPLGLAEPSLGIHVWDEYLLGDDLLVAPVVTRGERERTVWFPAGEWVEWWSGRRYSGPAADVVPAPLSDTPFFLRRGGIIPLLRPTIDTLVATEEPTLVDSYALDSGVLYARVFPGGHTSFRVFDGTQLTQKTVSNAAGETTVELSYSAGSTFHRGAVFEIVGFSPGDILSVRMNTGPLDEASPDANLEMLDYAWRRDAGATWVRVPGGPAAVEIKVRGSL